MLHKDRGNGRRHPLHMEVENMKMFLAGGLIGFISLTVVLVGIHMAAPSHPKMNCHASIDAAGVVHDAPIICAGLPASGG